MKSKSWRHHYIQQFLIKGFLNDKGKVFVYDKESDKIQTTERSTKSIMFEPNKNTMFFENGNSTSIIEDLLYSKKDDTFGKLITELQNSKVPNENLDNQKIADFATFIIDLFWRIPSTDAISKHVIDEKLKKTEKKIFEKDSFYKLYRTLLYQHTLQNPEKLKNKKFGFYTKVYEIDHNILILGDSPIVYEKTPENYDDLFDLDYCIAISSNRLVVQSSKEIKTFAHSKAMDYNNLVVKQSKKYVCSGNKTLLQSCVDYHKKVTKLDLEIEHRKDIFER